MESVRNMLSWTCSVLQRSDSPLCTRTRVEGEQTIVSSAAEQEGAVTSGMWTLGQSVGHLASLLDTWPVCCPFDQSVDQSVRQSLGHLASLKGPIKSPLQGIRLDFLYTLVSLMMEEPI